MIPELTFSYKIKKGLTFFSIALIMTLMGCADKNPDDFIFVEGGKMKNTKSNLYGKDIKIPDFYIAKHEVTQQAWNKVMDNNPSEFKGDRKPVETVTWYDCIEYCNKKSLKEGLEPYYNINKNKKDPDNKSPYDSMKWVVTINKEAKGYRLPTEAEWEYAASGGQQSENYSFSGSNNINEVAWYWKNSGDTTLTGSWHWSKVKKNNGKTHPVGLKAPNELGIYDMSGNVREWCQGWYQDQKTGPGYYRAQRGGGWLGGAQACKISYRGKFEANGKGPDQGFRLCRSVNP